MESNEKPIIFDTSDGQELRINMIGSWLRRRFGRKVVKLSLDGGFTCPNRDGTKAPAAVSSVRTAAPGIWPAGSAMFLKVVMQRLAEPVIRPLLLQI